MGDAYLVEIKPSARRINAAAGEYVNREGRFREFDSKRAAREWASGIGGGDGAVRVQDAPPHDRSFADGYLVADPARRRVEAPERPDLSTTPLDAYANRP